MARSTKTTRTSVRRASEPAPRKQLGRPPGSKNKVTSAAQAKATPVARTTRIAPRAAAASATPKLNKAELEQQVVKLERTITRLRKQNTELKQAAREEARGAAKVAPAPIAKTRQTPKRAASPAARRNTKAVEEPAAEAPATTAAAKKTLRPSPKARRPRAAKPDVAQEPSASADHEDEAAAED